MSAIRSEPRSPARWERVGIRVLDVVLSVILLLVFTPVLLFLALVVRADSHGPALFRQTRVGRDRRPFTMLKFRTMTSGCSDALHRELMARELAGEDVSEDGTWKIADDPRVTRTGTFLRRTSLDELPQLFNVLSGSMSLVGPRPCLSWEADEFPAEYAARFDVRPGLTGLWQVNGRSTVSTLDMLRLDAEYAAKWGFWTNVKILLRTVPALVRGGGAR